jgi:hypothetical protein
MKKLVLSAATLCILISQSACFGSFGLTKTIYEWNDSVTQNKFVKTLIFYGLSIIPVYAIGVMVDVIILNLIEFWSGSNPMAMNEGDMEEQLVMYKGDMYKITATKNKFSFAKMDGDKAIDLGALELASNESAWNYVKDEKATPIVKFNGNKVDFLTSNGVQTVDFALIDEKLNATDNLALN